METEQQCGCEIVDFTFRAALCNYVEYAFGWQYKRTLTEDILMPQPYTAIIQKTKSWWIGWIEEIPGVNSQGKTRKELVENLRSALGEALEMNRQDALSQAKGKYVEETILL